MLSDRLSPSTRLLNAMVEPVRVVLAPRVTSPPNVWAPVEVTLVVLIAVAPETASVDRPVTVSPGPFPKTAPPVTSSACPPPITWPLNVTVEATMSTSEPSVTVPWYVCVPDDETSPVLIRAVPVTSSVVRPDRVSDGASPNVAAPLMSRLLFAPTTSL